MTRDRRLSVTRVMVARRLAGVGRALAEHGLSWDEVPLVECERNDAEAGAAGAGHLLGPHLPGRPSAVVCLTDLLALGALRLARDRGVTVPGELSVVGFDDAPPARTAYPPLTTVAQPLRERGAEVGRLVRDLLAGLPVTSPPPFATSLVVRGSSAAPPG